MTNSDLHSEVGSYVTDALEADERSAFEAHLGRVAPCAGRRSRSSTRRSPTSPVSARRLLRPALRDSVLAGIRRGAAVAARRARRPTGGADPDHGDPTRGAAVRRGGGDSAPDWDRPVDELAERRQWRRTRILTAAVAAVLVIALGLGGWVVSLVQRQQALTAGQEHRRGQRAARTGVAQRSGRRGWSARARPGPSTPSSSPSSATRGSSWARISGTRAPARPTSCGPSSIPRPRRPTPWSTGYGRTQTWLDGQVDPGRRFRREHRAGGGIDHPHRHQSRHSPLSRPADAAAADCVQTSVRLRTRKLHHCAERLRAS